jgi:predicted RNA-binding protein
MCETNAFIWTESGEEPYLDNVDVVRPEEGRVYLKNLFGEQKVFEGRIREITLMKHKILLQK